MAVVSGPVGLTVIKEWGSMKFLKGLRPVPVIALAVESRPFFGYNYRERRW
jgi:hypothetical protein